MKICVFSDVHGNISALEEMLKNELTQIDRFVFLGDVFGYFAQTTAVIDRLLAINNLTSIRGNHDGYYLNSLNNNEFRKTMVEKYGKSYELELGSKQLKFIESMLNKESETIDGIKIAFYHGGPGDYAEQRIYPDTVLVKEEYSDFDFVFTGHTHYQLQTKIGECVVVNPGSLGQPRDGKGFSYCVFDTAFKRVEFRTVKADIDYELNNVNELEGCSCNYCYLERKYKVNI